MGIIDTVSAGFRMLGRKLWLAVLPVLLDLSLWLGPKFSIAPIIEQTLTAMRAAADALEPSAGVDTNLAAMMDGSLEALQETVGRTNFLSLLAWGRLGVPSIASLRPIEIGVDRVFEATSYGQMLLAQIAIMAVGLLIACFYLGLLAQAVRDESPDLLRLIRGTPRYWLHMAAVLVPFGVFMVFIVSIALIFGPFAVFVLVGLIWLMIYLSFFPQAIVLADEGSLAALGSTFRLVRSNFWPTLGLLLLVNLLSTGLGLVWARLLVFSPVTAMIAIVANALLGTGLTLALFIFYRERMAALLEAYSQQRSS